MCRVSQVVTSHPVVRLALAGVGALLLAGCQALAITAAGIGASTGLSHTANSISSRTFTASGPQVRQAALLAMDKMGMKFESSEKNATTETLRATLSDRNVEIEVEALNELTTRLSTSAQWGLFSYDGATARELVVQTELAMAEIAQPRKARAPSKSTSALADPMLSGVPPRR